jgi:hypothetical protein
MCRSCNGTGERHVKSELDVIRLFLPPNATQADLLKLSELRYDYRPPIDGMKYMDDKVQLLMRMITSLVFNQDLTEQVSMATATAVNAAVDSISNHLRLMAEQIENAWEFCHVIAMGYMGIDPERGEASLTHPTDFEIEPMSAVIANYAAAKAAGLPQAALDPLARRILNRMYRNDPRRVNEAMAFEEWRPFRGKADNLAAMIAGGLDPMDNTRILWEHFDRVAEEARALMPQGKTFDELSRARQGQIITRAIETVKEGLTPLAAPALPDPFTFDEIETEDDEPEE